MTALIFHVCKKADWEAAQVSGAPYGGSADDLRDGFIHFSAADQLETSVAKHRPGQTGLLLLAVDPERLGDALKWEPSRGGALFPHLYGSLSAEAVVWARDLPLGPEGRHVFPDLTA